MEDTGLDQLLQKAREDNPLVDPSPPKALRDEGLDQLLQNAGEDDPLDDPSPPQWRKWEPISFQDLCRCVHLILDKVKKKLTKLETLTDYLRYVAETHCWLGNPFSTSADEIYAQLSTKRISASDFFGYYQRRQISNCKHCRHSGRIM